VAEHTRSASFDAPADRLFDYLSDIENLPRYFDSMTSAEPAEDDAVRTTANVDGQKVEGEAWFRVDDDARRIEWGSEGPNDYSGWLRVADGNDGGHLRMVDLSAAIDHGEHVGEWAAQREAAEFSRVIGLGSRDMLMSNVSCDMSILDGVADRCVLGRCI
jgi:hypothetical protein